MLVQLTQSKAVCKHEISWSLHSLVTCVAVGVIGAGAYSAGWRHFSAEVVVPIVEPFRALAASIAGKVFGDYETISKKK